MYSINIIFVISLIILIITYIFSNIDTIKTLGVVKDLMQEKHFIVEKVPVIKIASIHLGGLVLLEKTVKIVQDNI